MLSSLRKFSETVIAKIFILLIALSFVFWGINDFFRSSYSNAVAEINGEEISFNQFLNEFNKIVRNNKIESEKIAINKNIHIIAVSNIVSEKLLKIHAKKLGVFIDDTTIAIEIKNSQKQIKHVFIIKKVFFSKQEFILLSSASIRTIYTQIFFCFQCLTFFLTTAITTLDLDKLTTFNID